MVCHYMLVTVVSKGWLRHQLWVLEILVGRECQEANWPFSLGYSFQKRATG